MTTSIPPEKTKSRPVPATKKPPVAKRGATAPPKAKQAGKPTGAKKPASRGSKTAKILDLLKRPTGVTLKEIMKATDWQAHSVRGFLSGTVKKKMGTPVESFNKNDGERAYRISAK